ncbi:MAG TPA: efflux RND transporter periplasmic adaptor subunit [Candidatus Sumerlaeota bacterium]|nr:efflux RND transporter periplasmic adaptor subunit [Candidatus Sumerlaeota bacterium]HPS02604.1 efflux RND transporter periplasmic adaptor subunit [Candidatus Sumerlaeota bacterium]
MNRKTLFSLFTWVVGLALLALIIAYLAGVFRQKVEPGKLTEPAGMAPAFQKIEAVREENEPQIEKAPGTLSALRETAISSRIMATINEIAVRAGDVVTPGQTLVRLDSRDLEAREQQARQATAAVRARLTEAAQERERIQKLIAASAASKSQLDAAEAAWKTAQAEVSRAEQAASEAGTGRAWATLDAPFAGRVVDRYAEPGDTAMPGQPILKLYDPTRMRLETYVRESLTGTLKPGQKLQVQIDALGTSVEGVVEEIVPQSEPGSRSVQVKVALPQRDDLYPGMFGRLLIPAGQARRVYVPETALRRVGQLEFVWVVGTDNRADRRFVKLGGEKKDGWVEVLSGLQSGERVGISE